MSLVERLRELEEASQYTPLGCDVFKLAADRIEELERELRSNNAIRHGVSDYGM